MKKYIAKKKVISEFCFVSFTYRTVQNKMIARKIMFSTNTLLSGTCDSTHYFKMSATVLPLIVSLFYPET
jgi:hypothetical protein